MREDVGLARALYDLEEQDFVPIELYRALAIVYDWAQDVLARRRRPIPWIERCGEKVERGATEDRSEGEPV